MKILVRSSNWIGDHLLSYPFFVRLRALYPNAWISVATLPSLQDLQFKTLVNEVIVLPKHPGKGWWKAWKGYRAADQNLRSRSWDLGMTLAFSFSSAAFLWQLKIPKRVGIASDFRTPLLTEAISPSGHFHRSEVFWSLLGEDAGPFRLPSLPDLKTLWDPTTFFEPPSEPYWVIAPGSQAISRTWPWESFLEVIERVVRATSWKTLVVGGPREAEWVSSFFQAFPHKIKALQLENWTNRGGVSAYASVFQKAQLTLTNDSGLAHWAAFCGSPLGIVWGAGQPTSTFPLYASLEKSLFLSSPPPCWPCIKNECLYSPQAPAYLRCLKGLSASQVFEKLNDFFLDKTSKLS